MSHERWCARHLPDVALGSKLGSGAFGVVFSARHKPTSASIALKMSDKSLGALADAKVLHRVRAEARVLRKLGPHLNIMRCFGAVEDESMVALVLSLETGQSLAAHLAVHGAMAEATAAPIVLQVARALRHCHAKKIAHRDVKCDNIVFDSGTGRAVLCDFGVALAVRTQGSRLDVRCGSAEYNAPEVMDAASKGYYGPAVDSWALGVVTYLLLCGQFPFGRSPPLTKVCRGSYDKAPFDERGVCSKARDFVSAALTVDPNSVQKVNRLTCADACKHAWLKPHEATADAAAATAASLPTQELVEAVESAQQAVDRDAADEDEDTGANVDEDEDDGHDGQAQMASGGPDASDAESPHETDQEALATAALLQCSIDDDFEDASM